MSSMIASADESKDIHVMVDLPRDIPSIKRMKLDREAQNNPQAKGSFDAADERGNNIASIYTRSRSATPSNIQSKAQENENCTLSFDQREITDTGPTNRIEPIEMSRDENVHVGSNHRNHESRKMTMDQEKDHANFAIPESHHASWPDLKYREETARTLSCDETRSSSQKETEQTQAPPGYAIHQQQPSHFVPMPSVVWFNQHHYPPTYPYSHQPAISFPYEPQQYWVFPVHSGSPVRMSTTHLMPPIDSSTTEGGVSQPIPIMPPLINATSTPWSNTLHQQPTHVQVNTAPQPQAISVSSTNNVSHDHARSSGPSYYSQVTKFTGLSHHLAPYYARAVIPLSTSYDEEWLSEFLCFVRRDCIEVFTAGHEDVASRMNSKKVMENQVGIRCRFCAHVPHRERAGRSSSFPSSISRIYQSITMMLRDHFPNCEHMPTQIKERYTSLKANASQGATDSKRYWIDSAHELGLIDTPDCGIRFNDLRGPNREKNVNLDQPYMF